MSQRDFPWPGDGPSSDESRVGNRMVGRTERPRSNQALALREPADRVNLGYFERLFEIQGRQDRRNPLREHRLSGPRRAYNYYVVAPARRHLQRPLGVRLSLHFGKIDRVLA